MDLGIFTTDLAYIAAATLGTSLAVGGGVLFAYSVFDLILSFSKVIRRGKTPDALPTSQID